MAISTMSRTSIWIHARLAVAAAVFVVARRPAPHNHGMRLSGGSYHPIVRAARATNVDFQLDNYMEILLLCSSFSVVCSRFLELDSLESVIGLWRLRSCMAESIESTWQAC